MLEDAAGLSLEELERLSVERVLERTGGHKARAAQIPGLGRRTLFAELNGEPEPPGPDEG